jgi:hypothetical protein
MQIAKTGGNVSSVLKSGREGQWTAGKPVRQSLSAMLARPVIVTGTFASGLRSIVRQ